MSRDTRTITARMIEIGASAAKTWHDKFRQIRVRVLNTDLLREGGITEDSWQVIAAGEYVCPGCGAKYDDPDTSGNSLSGKMVEWVPDATAPAFFVLVCHCGKMNPERDWLVEEEDGSAA